MSKPKAIIAQANRERRGYGDATIQTSPTSTRIKDTIADRDSNTFIWILKGSAPLAMRVRLALAFQLVMKQERSVSMFDGGAGISDLLQVSSNGSSKTN